MTATFQIASDLHIEYKNNECVNPLDYITPSADVLILAGDIGSLYKYPQLFNFIDGLVEHFKHILYIPGNHEYYKQPEIICGKSINELRNLLLKISQSWENVTVLDRNSVKIGDTCIVGATLWSELECEIPKFIVRIKGITNEIYSTMHNNDLAYIENMTKYCKENKLKMICVTHHPPTHQVVTSDKSNKRKFKSLYSTDLTRLLTKDYINTWVCGHVHSNFDFITENGCRVVGNQKGKPKDNINDYNKSFVL